jgi:hypothetical protein
MQIDWYDQSILRFVLDSDLLSRPSSGTGIVQFGLDARRIRQRFEAVLYIYASQQIALDEADLELIRRAIQYRERNYAPDSVALPGRANPC